MTASAAAGSRVVSATAATKSSSAARSGTRPGRCAAVTDLILSATTASWAGGWPRTGAPPPDVFQLRRHRDDFQLRLHRADSQPLHRHRGRSTSSSTATGTVPGSTAPPHRRVFRLPAPPTPHDPPGLPAPAAPPHRRPTRSSASPAPRAPWPPNLFAVCLFP